MKIEAFALYRFFAAWFSRGLPALAFSAVLFLASPSTARSQALLYTFNDTGTASANSGSKGTSSAYNLTLDNASGVATDLHTASGGGLTGLPGDSALDLSAATGIGNATGAVGPTATDGGGAVFNSDVSLTITGWFNAAPEIGSGGRILAAGALSAGYSSTNGTTGALNLSLPSATGTATSSIAYTAGTWEFFAITWVASTGAVSFYAGDANSADSLSAAGTGTQSGAAMAAMGTLILGGDAVGASNNRPFDGLLDDLAIYTSTADASGALDATALESIRLADLSPAPEPGTLGILLFGTLALAARGWMARRKAAERPA